MYSSHRYASKCSYICTRIMRCTYKTSYLHMPENVKQLNFYAWLQYNKDIREQMKGTSNVIRTRHRDFLDLKL